MCPVLIVILNTPLLFFLTNVLVLISSVLALAKLPFWITLDLTLLCIFFVKTLPANFKKIPDKKEGIFLLQNLFLKILVLVNLIINGVNLVAFFLLKFFFATKSFTFNIFSIEKSISPFLIKFFKLGKLLFTLNFIFKFLISFIKKKYII